MWRTGYDDEWKRRKEYLIRSLFDEVPLLSPVAEVEESFTHSDESPSGHDVRRPSDLLPSTVESRPYSPLPSLIIEKEPDRHDEPKEYYRQLELKMRRLYRRLFIEGRSVSSSLLDFDYGSESIDSRYQHLDVEMQNTALQCTNQETNDSHNESNINNEYNQEEENNTESSLNNNVIYQRNISDLDFHVLKRLSDPISEDVEGSTNHIEQSKTKGINTSTDADSNSEGLEQEHDSTPLSDIHKVEKQDEFSYVSTSKIHSNDTSIQKGTTIAQKRTPEKFATSSSSESSREYFQQMTFKAQVHREDNAEDVEKQCDVYEEPENNVLSRVLGENRSAVDQGRMSSLDNMDENQVPESHGERTTERSASEENEDIEMMRTPRVNPSAGSLQNESSTGDSSHISLERRKTRRRSLEIYSPSETLGDQSNLIGIERCSDDFSKILQSSTPKRSRTRRTLNNEVSRVISSVPYKRQKSKDASVQVSDRSSWNSLRHHFFAGSPKIFRLCSCKNHFCYR